MAKLRFPQFIPANPMRIFTVLRTGKFIRVLTRIVFAQRFYFLSRIKRLFYLLSFPFFSNDQFEISPSGRVDMP